MCSALMMKKDRKRACKEEKRGHWQCKKREIRRDEEGGVLFLCATRGDTALGWSCRHSPTPFGAKWGLTLQVLRGSEACPELSGSPG